MRQALHKPQALEAWRAVGADRSKCSPHSESAIIFSQRISSSAVLKASGIKASSHSSKERASSKDCAIRRLGVS